MRTSRFAAAGATLLFALASAGCGEGDDTLSASEYRSQGNAICQEAGRSVRNAVPDEPPTVQAIQEGVAPALARALSPLGDRLRQLRPPQSLAGGHGELLAAAESAVRTAEEAARDGSVAARLREEGPPLEEIGERAVAIGLTSCAG
jgi:hypothetical protein